ncbi:MAG: MaoC family dehydratase N-terminal domain-containing protein [Cognatishimia sp.]
MHAAIGDGSQPAPAAGALLPPLWHWAAFPPLTPTDHLGEDGHPPTGGLLPPMAQKRRMWAGGSLRFHAPLLVGEKLKRKSTVLDIKIKETGAGDMVLVTVEHRICGQAGLAIEERQDIVYLNMPTSFVPPKKRAMPDSPAFQASHATPATLLFRYSAVTYNAHRIHYDLPYAQEVEHYPALVVHGPLQATLLMQAATAHKDAVPSDFHYRGVHPMFGGTDLDIVAVEEDGALNLFTGQDGHQGMQATAMWEAA